MNEDAWAEECDPEELQKDSLQVYSRFRLNAVAAAEKGDFQNATNLFAIALRSLPKDAENAAVERAKILEMQAQIYLELGRNFDAIQAAEKALQNNSGFAFAHVTLGRAQINFGELEMALESLKTARGLLSTVENSEQRQAVKESVNFDILRLVSLLNR